MVAYALSGVRAKNWSDGTIRVKIIQLCAFSHFLALQQIIKRRHRPPKFNIKPKRRDLPNSDDWQKLFDNLRTRYESATLGRRKSRWRDYLVCRILNETGMRISECARLKVKDLVIYDAENFWLFVDGTKTENAERCCPISEKLTDEIRAYLWTFRVQNREARIFTSKTGNDFDVLEFERFIKGFAAKLNISAPVTPHVFRHDYIFRSILSGMSAFNLIARLGHSDMKQTFHYFKQVKRLMPFAKTAEDFQILEHRLRARGEYFSKRNDKKGW